MTGREAMWAGAGLGAGQFLTAQRVESYVHLFALPWWGQLAWAGFAGLCFGVGLYWLSRARAAAQGRLNRWLGID